MLYPNLVSSALILLLLGGCVAMTDNGGSGADEFFNNAEPFSFQTVEIDPNGSYDVGPRNDVIRDGAVFGSFWDELHGNRQPIPPVPQVDFTEQMIIVTVMGTRTSGGYRTEIVETALGFDRLGIRIQNTIPGDNCGVTGALTNPYHIVKVDRTEHRVRFYEEMQTLDCPK